MVIKLPFPPSANRYWRVFRGRAVKSPEARQYQANVRALATGHRPLTGRVSVELRFIRPARRGDLDNRLKVLLDALKGVAYLDDKQVTRILAEQVDGTPDTAGVTVTVWQLEGGR